MSERAFDFLPLNDRPEKPRETGMTEIRGPAYAPMGVRELKDLLETMGRYIDIYKFGMGSFVLMDQEVVEEIIDTCHQHDVLVSTGGFLENVLVRARGQVEDYIAEAAEIGFDIVEVSRGYIAIDQEDLYLLTELIQEHGLKAKPEVGLTFRGGQIEVEELEEEIISTQTVIDEAKGYLDAGAHMIMVEEEGITEGVWLDDKSEKWRTDVAYEIVSELGKNNCMFEASDPPAFEWYIRNFGPNVNLFVGGSQIVQLEAMRSGINGKTGTWGRIVSYKGN